MPKQNVYVQSFNVGVVDRKKLVRVDLERMRLAAEYQTNLLCTVAGNMFLRPGTEFIRQTKEYQRANIKEFVFSADDAALLEFTPFAMRVYVDDAVIQRPFVNTDVNHGDFSGTGTWALTATDGATCVISSDALRMRATARGSKATAKQQVTVAAAYQDTEHALAIHVQTGPVTFRCGSTNGGDQYIPETQLAAGYHSLSFTPGADFWIFFQSNEDRTEKVVRSCEIEGSGIMEVQTPWTAGDLNSLRMTQSADVIFVASGKQQYRIERRSERSWSVVEYLSNYGPFTIDRTAPVRLRPNATEGNTTLEASDNFFSSDHVGAIFRLFHNGQSITQILADDQIFTDPIKVTGVDGGTANTNDRDWTYTTTGTWVGTLVVQRSFDSDSFGFKNYRNSSSSDTVGFTSNVTDILEYDSDDNAVVYYRLGFPQNNYTSGAATIEINYDGGGGYGICRVTAFNDKQSVDIEIIKPFKGTTFTDSWREGMWSDEQNWPTGTTLTEGRLFWAGDDKLWASVSDAYDDFDEETEGDSGPISRSIAIGGVNTVQWLMPLQRVVIGANGGEISVKSSGLDEPLTPTGLTLKSSSTIGSADIDAARVDGRGIFVDRTARALFQLEYDGGSGDYRASELTRLCSSWFDSGIVDIAVSRRPDTRIWAVLENGNCICMVYEPDQEVIAFVPLTTAGSFERVCVLPGAEQDSVYFVIRRFINSETRRYIEKMALDREAAPGTVAKVMDCFGTGTNDPPSATISGLTHIRGRSVKVWADGAPITEVVNGITQPRLFVVSDTGTITLDSAVTDYCVGLAYQGVYKSARLAYGAVGGTSMLQKKTVSTLGLVMSDYVRSGVQYGPYLDNTYHPMMPLPALRQDGVPDEVSLDIVEEERTIPFAGGWTTDSRVCLTVDWSANFLGMVFDVDANA